MYGQSTNVLEERMRWQPQRMIASSHAMIGASTIRHRRGRSRTRVRSTASPEPPSPNPSTALLDDAGKSSLPMTVCIAALYEHGRGVVMASDRMVTAHIPIGYEFEHEENTKITRILDTSSIRVLLAGDVLRGHEILGMARTQLAQKKGHLLASEAAEVVRCSYQDIRRTSVVHTELEPRGLDLNGFYGLQQQLLPQVVQMIDNALSSSDLGVQMLITGANDQVHSIYTIMNPGTIHDHGGIGHGAIGSGAPHALSSLIEDSYAQSMTKEKVIELVKKAKLRSEVAPGVGSETTIVTIPTEDSSDAQPEQDEAAQS